uniref:Uncharacterized protein n=1 Tax=Salix viminalis TaxID=40686 RepID=A0A6N2MUB6_SALVM
MNPVIITITPESKDKVTGPSLFTFTSLICVLLLLQFNISNLDLFPILKVTSLFFPEVRVLGFVMLNLFLILKR